MKPSKKKVHPVDLSSFQSKGVRDASNRRLLSWLSDEVQRAQLYQQVNQIAWGGTLTFPSRDAAPPRCDCEGIDKPLPENDGDHQWVELITDWESIKSILINADKAYSSRVYAELGGGNFMLALDPGSLHKKQREAYQQSFPDDPRLLQELAHAACESAAILGFRAPEFDLAAYAEQAALRCVQMLFGYALKDYRLLEQSLGAAYRALVYQVMERHFISNPTLIPEARAAMARLLARTSTLIDAYAAEDEDELKGTVYPERPAGIEAVLKKLGTLIDKKVGDLQVEVADLNGEQRATLALGAAVGMVGNVQAAACLVVKALFAGELGDLDEIRREARAEWLQSPTRRYDAWKKRLAPALRKNPPIPFLPRLRVDKKGNKIGEVLLALGGASADPATPEADADAVVWGLPGAAKHNCLGEALAWPLIIEIVRHVMALPHLAQALDPETGEVLGLTQRNGFACEHYPLTHRRDRRCAQTSLNVAMRIKAPVKDNVERVRELLRSGAPRIERALRQSAHVHFAWFELIEADTVLLLHTVYDGPFGAYLQHFALDAGDLFDQLFQYIEDPPPMPVDKFPNEFAAHLLRYNRGPAAGYFFSAYPNAEVAKIVRNERSRG